MKATVKVVRMYASKSYCDTGPRVAPDGMPITLEHYPLGANADSQRARVYLGAPLEEAITAEHIRWAYVFQIMRHAPLFSPFQLLRPLPPLEPIINEVADKDEHPQIAGWKWFVTLVVERDVTIDDTMANQDRYFWLDEKAAANLQSAFIPVAFPCLDDLATRIAPKLGRQFFAHILIDCTPYISTPEKEPFVLRAVTRTSGPSDPPAVSGLDVSALTSWLERAAGPNETPGMLDSVQRWYLDALKENDAWKRFDWGFLALEILINKAFTFHYKEVTTRLGDRQSRVSDEISNDVLLSLLAPQEKLYLAERFTALAHKLLPDTAESDIAQFGVLKKTRDGMSHGDAKKLNAMSIDSLFDLLERYLVVVLDASDLRIIGGRESVGRVSFSFYRGVQRRG
jgi:hypothetical protein